MRIILYTGKGGVGKTSMAAATACKIAQEGNKVLIMSTDQAHSLGDSFSQRLFREPEKVTDNLYALEIDTVYEGEKSWANMKGYLKELLSIQGSGGIEAEELLIFPGLEELFAMFKILEIYEAKKYDVLIVDCAPTGETLSFLKYPEKLSDFMQKVLPIKRKGVKVVGPAVERITKVPMPDDNVFDDLESIMNRMEQLQKLLSDKSIVSLRIVTTPEKIVIKEAKRNFTCLHLYNYNVDAIIVNRIYPDEAMKGYFNKWIQMQDEGLREIKECFSEIPKYYVNLQKEELRSIPVLQRIGNLLFNDGEAQKVLFNKKIYTVEQQEKHTLLKIYLPFVGKNELELGQINNELILGAWNEVRRFPLPLSLEEKEIISANLKDEYLTIEFNN